MTAQETLAVLHDPEKTEHMRKLLLSLREEALRTVVYEADSRGVSVQELLRAVIIPEWFRDNVRMYSRAVFPSRSTRGRISYRNSRSES
jgi:hypothetical protein